MTGLMPAVLERYRKRKADQEQEPQVDNSKNAGMQACDAAATAWDGSRSRRIDEHVHKANENLPFRKRMRVSQPVRGSHLRGSTSDARGAVSRLLAIR